MQQRQKIVTLARAWLGTPYLHQACLRGIGCDCLGLIRGVYREFYGVEPELSPPYSQDWAETGQIETLAIAARKYLIEINYNSYQAGDVLLFRWRDNLPAKHLAIATSKDTRPDS